MIDLHKLKESIERATAAAADRYQAELQHSMQAALANSVAALKRTVVDEVLAELEPLVATTPGGAPTDLLNSAAAAIQEGNTQSEILGALLAGVEHFSERCGLLVVRSNQASGWAARGFDSEAFKGVRIDVSHGLAERAVKTRGPVTGAAREFDGGFVDKFGAPADGNIVLMPLVVRDRVAALLYADGGKEGVSGLDASGIEVLVRTTDLWLELISARKAAEQGAAGNESGTLRAPEAAAQHAAPAQAHAAAAHHESSHEAAGVAEAPAVELDEMHKKAKRFAKLLVDEIKLYNQAKVNEGRANRDIYERLREDIEKSRAAYAKRFGESVSDADYFSSELVRILADNDRGLMGGSFPA